MLKIKIPNINLIIAKDRQFSTEKDLKKRPWGVAPMPYDFLGKNRVKLLVKCNFIAFFGIKLYFVLLRFGFSKFLPNKISFAALLPSLKGKVAGVSLTEGLAFLWGEGFKPLLSEH